MIINPEKKRDYVMVKAETSTNEVMTYEIIKKLILDSFPPDISRPQADRVECGYVEPGHGLKGKKEWFFDDTDVNEFLSKFKSKKRKEFTLWCYSQSTKGEDRAKRGSKRSRSKSPAPESGSSRHDAHVSKMAKVDDIYKQIHDKHGNLFFTEQKRVWAHMVELGKHDSIAQPPNKRFFKSPSTEGVSVQSASSSVPKTSVGPSSASTPALVTSPGHRVSIRSECIDQLKKWHSLLDCGAIFKEQYEEIQGSILSDVRKL